MQDSTDDLVSPPTAAVRRLVRLLARQAAREWLHQAQQAAPPDRSATVGNTDRALPTGKGARP